MTIAEISAKPEGDIVAFFVTQSTVASSAAVHAAKAIIALVDKTGSEAAARAALKAAKASESAVKNSLQLVWAYDEVVRPGHASEKWFDGLLYMHAVAVRQAIKARGVKALADAGLFNRSAKQNLVEFELVAETGKLRAEREADLEKAAQALVEADKAKAEAAAEAATAPVVVVETPAPAPVVEATAAPVVEAPAPTPPPAPVTPEVTTPAAEATAPKAKKEKAVKTAFDEIAEALTLADKLIEATIPGLNDLAVEAIRARMAQTVTRLNAAVDARANAAKAAA